MGSDLVEGEDTVDLLAGDGLRDGDLPLVVVAGDDLGRVAADLVVAERPAAEEDLDVHRLLLVLPRRHGGGGGGEEEEGNSKSVRYGVGFGNFEGSGGWGGEEEGEI
jgi:hypothetical protein